MSAATEFPPVVTVPERARAASRRPARVLTFPSPGSDPASPAQAAPAVFAGVPSQAPVALPSGLQSASLQSAPSHPASLHPVSLRPAVRSARVLRPAPPAARIGVGDGAVDGQVRSLRLTGRGRLVLALAAVALAVGFVWLARASAPASSGDGARVVDPGIPAAVTVHAGDTLWSIATAVDPRHDPRDVVNSLQRINHLTGVSLVPGQVLRTR